MPLRKKSREVSPGSPGNRWAWSRLVLLIAIPVAVVIALGGMSIVSSWRSAGAYQRTETLAVLSTKVTQLAFEIEAERDAIVWYIAVRNSTKNAAELEAAKSQLQIRQRIASTEPWIKIVDTAFASTRSGNIVAVHETAAMAALASLPILRQRALTTEVSADNVIAEYDEVVGVLIALDDQVAPSSGDPQLQSTARAMAQISRVEDDDSVQRALIVYGLTARRLTAAMVQQLTSSQEQQAADNSEFRIFATAGQVNGYQHDLANTLADRANSEIAYVVSDLNSIARVSIAPADWYGAISNTIGGVHKFEEYLASSAVNRASALHQRAITSAIVVGSLVLLVFLFSLLFTVFVGRSMFGQSRQLRVAARSVTA